MASDGSGRVADRRACLASDGSGRGADRRACLALILCATLAACGKRGVLELPPEEAAAGPPRAEPPEEEDEEWLRGEE